MAKDDEALGQDDDRTEQMSQGMSDDSVPGDVPPETVDTAEMTGPDEVAADEAGDVTQDGSVEETTAADAVADDSRETELIDPIADAADEAALAPAVPPMTTEDAADHEGEKPGFWSVRRNRVVVVVLAVLALVLGVAAFVVVDHDRNNDQAQEVTADEDDAEQQAGEDAAAREANTDLDDAITRGETSYADSANRVADGDEALRDELGSELDTARDLKGSGYDQVDDMRDVTAELGALTAGVDDAVMGHAEGNLSSAVGAGQDVLDDSEGQVSDNATRVRLADTIHAGQAALDEGSDAAVMDDETDSVTDATEAVRESMDEFVEQERQVEADRREQEREQQEQDDKDRDDRQQQKAPKPQPKPAPKPKPVPQQPERDADDSDAQEEARPAPKAAPSTEPSVAATPGKANFGPSYVRGIVNEQANATSSECERVTHFFGDQNSDFARQAAEARDVYGHVRFSVSGNKSLVTVGVLSCLN